LNYLTQSYKHIDSNHKLVQLLARNIALNHGYTLPDGDLNESNSPRAFLFMSDAEIGLQVIASYLAENNLHFETLIKE